MSENDEPKIIVDEDWKAQVEQEKEQLKERESAESNAGTADDPMMQIPEASIQVLLATIATQAISVMGLIPDPATGQVADVNLPLAKHLVDTVAVIEEKTKGNLTDEEAALIKENLHQLRMAYVAAVEANQSGGKSPAGESQPASSIQLP